MSQLIRMKHGKMPVLIEIDESDILKLLDEMDDPEMFDFLEEEDLGEEENGHFIDKEMLLDRVKDLINKQPIEETEQYFDKKLVGSILQNCAVLTQAFEKIKKENKIPPAKANVEFGLRFTGEGDIYVTKAAAEANFKVSFSWDLK